MGIVPRQFLRTLVNLFDVVAENPDAELPAHASSTIADIFKSTPEQLLALGRSPGRRFNVVLSDMAPRTTGNRLGDQTRSFELFMRAIAVAGALLKPGGSFVGKIFMGEDLPKAKAETRRLFTEERGIRPEGTRATSYEMFVVGLGKK